MPTEFTPYSALAGGLLIGLAATMLYATLGRIASISGILNHALEHRGGRSWRIAFLLSLVAGAGLWFLLGPDAAAPRRDFPVPWLVASGLLVGFGARLVGISTSGHSVVGLARWSTRPVVAVAVLLATAALTVLLLRHLLAGIA